ncbi:hypothetical protein RJI07_07835 [Mycoplasmatota bacterium WC30]
MNYLGGYEFQDRIASYVSLKEYLKGSDSFITCEKKEVKSDYFDDIIISNGNSTKKIQVKYSYNKAIDIPMLSSGDLSLLKHFNTYKQLIMEDKQFELNIITNRDLAQELFEETTYNNYGLLCNKLRIKKIISDKKMNSRFIKLKRELKPEDYELFKLFLDDLEFYFVPAEVSFQFFNEGEFESLIVNSLKNEVGVGTFPYENLSANSVALRLEEIFQSMRVSQARTKTLNINEIFNSIGIREVYETLLHRFPIDETKYIRRDDLVIDVIKNLEKNDKVQLIGEPGIGKSWFVEEFIGKLPFKYLRYCFFIDLTDNDYDNRVNYNDFLYNIKYQILKNNISSEVGFKYLSAVSEEELIDYINNINENVIVILDGIDHILRVNGLKEFEKIQKFINSIANNKFKLLCVSQPIDISDNIVKIGFDRLKAKEIYDYLKLYNFKQVPVNIEKVSGGNFLYLNYLAKKYLDTGFPNLLLDYEYDGNISKYYEYLINGEDYKNEVLSLISCTNIPLNNEEIKQILSLLQLKAVIKVVTDLKYLFKFDKNENIYIYHESLKRFFREQFVNKNIDYKGKYFRGILKVLEGEEKSLFSSRKKYKYYLPLLYELCEYNKIINVYSKDFVNTSIKNGHISQNIERNFSYFAKAAKMLANYSFLLELSELRKQINCANEHVPELLDIYYYNLKDFYKKEPNILNDIEFDFYSGYGEIITAIDNIASGNNFIASDQEFQLIKDDYLKSLYIKRCITNLKMINKEMIKAFKYIDVKSHDLSKTQIKDEIAILLGIDINYKSIKSDIKKVREILDKDYLLEGDLFNLLTNIVNLSVEEVGEFESLKESDFWKDKFYFVLINSYNRNSRLFDEKIIEFFKILKLKKEYIFKGKPRPVDFYFQNDELFFLVKYLIDNISDKSKIRVVLDVIEDTDHIYKYSIPGLKIPDLYYYIDIICNGKYNEGFISEFNNKFRGDDEYYFDMSKTSLDIMHFSKQKNKAVNLSNFSKEVCGYTMHKDMSLECLVEGIKHLEDSLDKKNKYFTLLDISKRVRDRTDGKETKHFEYRVFENFYDCFPNDALNYLINNLRIDIEKWQNTEMLKHIYYNINFDDELLEKIFYKALNSNDSSLILEKYCNIVKNNDDYFVKDIMFKVHKLNNYETDKDYESINNFIDGINKKYDEFCDVHLFEKTSNEKYLHKDNVVIIGEEISITEFWQLANNSLINFKDELTEKYIRKHICDILNGFDGKFFKQVLHKNIIELERFIDDPRLENDEKIMFYLKAFARINGGWGEKFEHFDLFMKAYEIDKEKTSELILDFLSEDVINNIYTLKSSSNKLKVLNCIYPERKLEHYEIIEEYECMLLPYYKKNTSFIKNSNSLDYRNLVIILMLEKMKFLNKENILNTLSVLYKYRHDQSLSKHIIEALIDFFSNYDDRFPLLYTITIELFYDFFSDFKAQIDLTKINLSNNISLKAYFYNNMLFPAPFYFHNNFYISTWLNKIGLPQFSNFLDINIALDKSQHSMEFQTILNKDLVSWDEINSVENINLIRMNEQFYFIQEILSSYDQSDYILNSDEFIANTKFNILRLIKQNDYNFIPKKNNKYINEERRYVFHNSNRYTNFSEHKYSKALYNPTDLFYDVLCHTSLCPYYIKMKTEEDKVYISHKILPTSRDSHPKEEKIEVLIQVESEDADILEKISFKDFLSTIYDIK